MELFSVQRYEEKQIEAKDALAPTDADQILKKLLRKAEKNAKRKRSGAAQENVVEPADETQTSKKSKHKKVVEQTEDSAETGDLTAEFTPVPSLLESPNIDSTQTHDEVFKVLGEDVDLNKRQKVDVVLPHWLAHPTVISTNIITTKDTESIGDIPFLAPHIRHSLKEINITRLFPVQAVVIPWILEAHTKSPPFRPRDICVSAPTGSGKTLAFAVPVVQLLANRVQRKIRALVVLPVAELALQIFKVFKKLCEKTDLTVCLLSNQCPFPLEQKKLVELNKGERHSKVDIVVTTPGRLVDHLHATKGFCLKSLKFLIIDEADRIMDAVFQNWLYHLDAHVRTTSDQLLSGRSAPLCYNELQLSSESLPHKLLFSATLSQDPEKLQNLHLFQPKLFTSVLTNLNELRENFTTAIASDRDKLEAEARGGEFIGKYTTPAELTEKYCITETQLKPLTLYSLIVENNWRKFLCFTNSTESSGRLAFVLARLCNNNLVVNELSASLGPKERTSVLSRFSRGTINGLICSDALARGIDIPDVDIVISYEPSRHIKTYIHRIGRTARAGRLGTAITLLTENELEKFNHTLAEVGKVITEEITISSSIEAEKSNDYSQALQALRLKLQHDKRRKILVKERIKKNSTQTHKDPAKMTLMEKLQAQASEVLIEKPVEKKKKVSGKTYKPKKFNASAAKLNKIKE